MISIKKLGIQDVEIAKELFALFQTEDQIPNPEIPPNTRIQELLSDNNLHILAAFFDHELAGGLTAFQLNMYKSDPVKMFLYEIGVKSGYRRRGIGKKLIEDFCAFSKQLGAHKMIVPTTRGHTEAIEFYNATGRKLEQESVILSYSI